MKSEKNMHQHTKNFWTIRFKSSISQLVEICICENSSRCRTLKISGNSRILTQIQIILFLASSTANSTSLENFTKGIILTKILGSTTTQIQETPTSPFRVTGVIFGTPIHLGAISPLVVIWGKITSA